MTRRLLAFFAPGMLMAQIRNRCAELDLNNPVPPECTEGRKPVWKARISRPKNGECPVCGTMAKPYKPDLSIYAGACKPCFVKPGLWENNCLSICTPFTEADLPKQQRIDCAHCNTTFRQWAEGKEPKR